jgi:hypothetical protein
MKDLCEHCLIVRTLDVGVGISAKTRPHVGYNGSSSCLRMRASVEGAFGEDSSVVVSICENYQQLVELTLYETFSTLPPPVVNLLSNFKR